MQWYSIIPRVVSINMLSLFFPFNVNYLQKQEQKMSGFYSYY